jgi:hypothetical protein
MIEAPEDAPADDGGEVVVRATASRLSLIVGHPPEVVVEAVVRDELVQRRATARIQAFVPILTERAARRRLARAPVD